MDAHVNHKISLTGGDDPGNEGPSLAVGSMGDARSISDSSPLQDFVRAKEKINDIFVEIADYVSDDVTYMQSVQQVGSIVKSDDAVQVEGYVAQVGKIRNNLARDHMKVAFFGRTSNGKSSVINAMLREEILPSELGHTACCFLQVKGSDNGESYLVTEGSTEKRNVKSVEQLAHALCEEKLEESQLVHIYWPKDKCHILRNDVVFVDSPGIDMSPNLDEWINRHCLDADVFVLVVNTTATLTHAEKDFFHKVSRRLAKPNIFILNNHWDVSASRSPDVRKKVREQHMEREVEFLVTELKACTQEEANQRIFFMSAMEALQARLQKQRGLPADSGALADGFLNRYSEFQDFERKFEECISKSAVRTKFEHPSQSGKLIVSEIQQIIDSAYDQAQQLKAQKAEAKQEIHDKLECTEQKLLLLTQEMKDKIRHMVEDVEQRVSKALSEEIDCLSLLLDEFNSAFHPEQRVLKGYKKKLHHHVVNELGSNLCARLSTELAMNIESSQREMTEQMSDLLPAENKQVSLNTLQRREPFKISYSLNCDKLFTDFQEDLSFRFSGVPRDSAFWSDVAVRMEQATMIFLREGFDPFVTAATLMSCVRLYAQHTWDNEAKEREFKRQFVDHATKQLQQIVDSASANCGKQVEQELSSTFAQLCDLIKEAINDMDAEIKTLDEEIKQLEEAVNSAKVLRNKADYITKQLELFDDAFLKPHN